MIFEIERLVMVVKEGSFTKAAKKLYITQPTLSLSISRLEQKIGKRIFKRIGKRFILTKDGESVCQIANQIIKLWGKMKDPGFSSNNIIYLIGLYDNAALKLSKYFQKKLSVRDLHFEITIDRSGNLIQGMQNGLFDICICIINPTVILSTNIILVKKFSEQLYPVSAKIWKEDVSKIPFIVYNKESATRNYIDEVFFNNNIKPNIIVESTSTTFMKELAIGACGVALLPKNFIDRELQQKKLYIQKFPFKFQRQIGLFLNKDGNPKKEESVVKEIQEYLE